MDKKSTFKSQESFLDSCEECSIGKAEILWQQRLVIDYGQPFEDLIATLPRNIKIAREFFDYKTNQGGIEEVNLALAKLRLNLDYAHHTWGPTHKESKIIISEIPWEEAGGYEIVHFSRLLSEIPFRDFKTLAPRDKITRKSNLEFATMLVCYERNAALGDICLDDISRWGNLYFLLVGK